MLKNEGTTMTNLPAWNGASSVYSRLMEAAERIQHNAYVSQRAADKRKGFRFSPSLDGIAISEALAIGDEEQCKALLWQHRA